MAQPMLGDIELQQVQKLDTDHDQVLKQHSVPALEGDFLQRLDRRAAQITLTGVLTGLGAKEGLKTLRDKFRAAEPVDFVADITTATRVGQVLIEEIGVRELAGKPERFEYAFTLREFVPPPATEEEEPPAIQQLNEEIDADAEQQVAETAEEITENVGELRVEVLLAENSQDFSNLVVFVEGMTDVGEAVYFTIETQDDGVYTRQNVPAGEYTVSIARR